MITLLKQTVIIILITFILFVSFEIGLRIFIRAGSEDRPIIFHSKYISHLNPNREYKFKRSEINGGESIVAKINKWGFRGEDFEPKTDEFRVFVYGDSNITARFSVHENTFVANLESQLETLTGSSFQVINAGVPGYGPDQILLRIEDEIPIWSPDLVIVNIFADNDLGDILRNRLIYVNKKTGKIENKGIPLTERLLVYVRDLYVLKAIKTVWYTISEVIGIPTEDIDLPKGPGLENLYRANHEEYAAYFDRSLPRVVGDHYDLDVALDPDSDSSKLKLILMEQILRRIHSYVNIQHKIPLLFLIQPSVRDISTNSKLNYKKLKNISSKYRRDNLTNAIQAILKKTNADFVNLFDAFVTNGRSPYYFLENDNHWNDQGQKLAAELVAEHILKDPRILPNGTR